MRKPAISKNQTAKTFDKIKRLTDKDKDKIQKTSASASPTDDKRTGSQIISELAKRQSMANAAKRQGINTRITTNQVDAYGKADTGDVPAYRRRIDTPAGSGYDVTQQRYAVTTDLIRKQQEGRKNGNLYLDLNAGYIGERDARNWANEYRQMGQIEAADWFDNAADILASNNRASKNYAVAKEAGSDEPEKIRQMFGGDYDAYFEGTYVSPEQYAELLKTGNDYLGGVDTTDYASAYNDITGVAKGSRSMADNAEYYAQQQEIIGDPEAAAYFRDNQQAMYDNADALDEYARYLYSDESREKLANELYGTAWQEKQLANEATRGTDTHLITDAERGAAASNINDQIAQYDADIAALEEERMALEARRQELDPDGTRLIDARYWESVSGVDNTSEDIVELKWIESELAAIDQQIGNKNTLRSAYDTAGAYVEENGDTRVYDDDAMRDISEFDDMFRLDVGPRAEYMQTYRNLNWAAGKAQDEDEAEEPLHVIDSVHRAMDEAGVSYSDDNITEAYMADVVSERTSPGLVQNSVAYYTPGEYATLKYARENMPEIADYLEEYYDREADKRKSEDVERSTLEHFEGRPVAAAPFAVAGGVTSVVDGIDTKFQSVMKDLGMRDFVNPYRTDFGAVGDAATEAGIKAVDEQFGTTTLNEMSGTEIPLIGDMKVSDLYATGVEAIRNYTNNLAFGPYVGAATFFQVYGDTYTDAYERGGTHDQANKLGMLSGLAEGVGEKLSYDTFTKMFGGDGITFKKPKNVMLFGLMTALENGEEFVQESATTAMNEAFDRYVMGENSQYNIDRANYIAAGYSPEEAERLAGADANERVLRDGVTGALTGLMRVGGGAIASKVSDVTGTVAADRSAGREIRKLGNEGILAERMSETTGKTVNTPKTNWGAGRLQRQYIDTLGSQIEMSRQAEDDAALEQHYEDLKRSFFGTADVDNLDVPDIDVEMIDADQADGETDTADVNTGKLTPAEKDMLLSIAGRIRNDRKLTGAQRKRMAGDEALAQTVKDLRGGKINADRTNTSKLVDRAVEAASATSMKLAGTTEETIKAAEERMQNMHVSKAASSTYNGDSVKINGIKKVADNDDDTIVTVTLEDGSAKDVKLSEISLSNRDAEIYAYAANMPTEALANQFRMLYGRGQDISRVAAGMTAAYEMGAAGYKNYNTVTESALTKGTSDAQIRAAYNLGQKAYEERTARDSDRARSILDAVRGKDWHAGRVDKTGIDYKSLSAQQRRDVDITEAIAIAGGIKVVFFESQADERGNYTRENGRWEAATRTIYLDVNAGRNKATDSMSETALLRTLSHELTHAMQTLAGDEYRQLREAVLDVLERTSGNELEVLIQQKMERDKTIETRDRAIDEVVAEACETMLRDSKAAEVLQTLHPKEARTFIDLVKDLLRDIKNAIKNAYGRTRSREAQIIEKEIDKIADKWTDAFVKLSMVSGREIAISEETQKRIDDDQPISGIDEIKNSICFDEKYMAAAEAKNKTFGFVSSAVMAKAAKDRATVRDFFRDPKNKELLKLPADVTGKTFFPNASYVGTEENTTVCIRSLAAQQLMDAISKQLGRPLVLQDTLLMSQEVAALTDKPECFYCYVATDRRAYREYLGEYLKQRDEVLAKYRKGMDRGMLYEEFLNKRENTDNMRERFDMWLEAVDKGVDLITGKDLASLEDLFAELGNHKKGKKRKLTTSRLDQLWDATSYAQSASWAKKMIGYAAYNNHILKWPKSRIDELNSGYGLRMYSFSDYSPAFVLENMQMITDAAVRGLNVLAYTKEMDFAEIFAPTGTNINVSVFATEVNGKITSDAMQGADWARAKALREEFPNVGTVMVATNDNILQWALEQDWIDVVIPFHLVRTGKKVAEHFGYKDYTSVSADKKTLSYKKGDPTSVSPVEHHNDIVDYVDALQKYGLSPRFADWMQGYDQYVAGEITPEQFRAMNPYYMKLVNETRRSYADTKPVQPVFNVDAAMESIDTMIKQGGYYQPIGGSIEKQNDLAEDIADTIRANSGDDFRYQPREDSMNTRQLLADMLQADVGSVADQDLLADYRERLVGMNDKVRMLADYRSKIRELMFKKGRTKEESETLKSYRAQVAALQEEISKVDETLLRLENSEVIRDLVYRGRAKLRETEAQKRRDAVQTYADRQRATAVRKNIIRRARRLDKLLREPKASDHVPEEFKEATLAMLEAFTSREDSFGGDNQSKMLLMHAKSAYEKMFRQYAETSPQLQKSYDEATTARLSELEDILKDKSIYKLGYEEMIRLSMVIEHFEKVIREANEDFSERRIANTVRDAALMRETLTSMQGRKDGFVYNNALVNSLRELKQSTVLPVYFFKHMGGTLGQLGQRILEAESTYGIELGKATQKLEELQERFRHDEWFDKKGDTLKIEKDDMTLELTREEALGIWATNKREKGDKYNQTHHLDQGGVVVDHRTKNTSWRGKVEERNALRLGEGEIAAIDNWLTKEQKDYADAVVYYLSHDMAALGNETSMELMGYKVFGSDYYYPYKTSSDFLPTKAGEAETMLFRNMGMTKALTRHAKTPIVITDFTSTVSDHINNMLLYSSFAAPQDAFMRVLDFKFDDGKSIKSLLANAYGTEQLKYIRTFMNDLYGAERSRVPQLISKVSSAWKKARVMASMSVVVQQPTAVLRAMAYVNPKYFAAQGVKLSTKAFEEAKKYSGTAVIKDMGRFDTGLGVTASDYISGKYRYNQGFINKVKNIKEKTDDVLGKGAEVADKWGWSYIWDAVKREQAEKTGLDVNSEELKQIAGKRMDEVVRLTQVYDSTLAKSQIMRNKDGLVQMFTAFMAEPLVTKNMMLDAWYEARKGNKKGAISRVAGVFGSMLLANMAKAIISAWREDDEDEKTYIEHYIENFFGGMFSDVNPINYMPYIRDMYSVLQGYDVERTDISMFSDIVKAIKIISNPDKPAEQRWKSFAVMVGMFTNIPIENIYKDLWPIADRFLRDEKWNTQMREGAVGKAVSGAAAEDPIIKATLKMIDGIFGTHITATSKNDYTDELYDKLLDGDVEAADEIRSEMKLYVTSGDDFIDDAGIDAALRSRIYDGFIDGDMDRAEATRMLDEHAGLTKTEAEKRTMQWQYEKDTKIKYDDVKQKYIDGKISDTEAMRALTEYGGQTEDEAEAKISEWDFEREHEFGYSQMKDAYLNGEITRENAISARVEYGGQTRSAAEETVSKWDFEAENDVAYSEMKDAYIDGDLTNTEVVDALMKYGGMREPDARAKAATWDYEKDTGREWDAMKDDYIAGRLTADQVVNARTEYADEFAPDVKAQIRRWDYEKDTGRPYNDMKTAYIDGEIKREDAIADRINYGGQEADAAELDVSKWDFEIDYGYDYDDMSDYFSLGRIDKDEAIAARMKYGLQDPDDAYFAVTGWEYENETGREWQGKNTKVYDAIDSGNAVELRDAITEVYEYSDYETGKKAASAVTSAITSRYKPLYIAASPAERAAMEPMLLDAYELAYTLAGEQYYGDSRKLKTIRGWLDT